MPADDHQQTQAEKDKQETQYFAEQDAKFDAAKLTDDKRAIVEQLDDVYGVGGSVLSPAQFKQAKVAFTLSRDVDGEWTLHRIVFKSDHISSETAEGFLTRPGPSKFR